MQRCLFPPSEALASQWCWAVRRVPLGEREIQPAPCTLLCSDPSTPFQFLPLASLCEVALGEGEMTQIGQPHTTLRGQTEPLKRTRNFSAWALCMFYSTCCQMWHQLSACSPTLASSLHPLWSSQVKAHGEQAPRSCSNLAVMADPATESRPGTRDLSCIQASHKKTGLKAHRSATHGGCLGETLHGRSAGKGACAELGLPAKHFAKTTPVPPHQIRLMLNLFIPLVAVQGSIKVFLFSCSLDTKLLCLSWAMERK